MKFNDLNGDGVWEEDTEPGLPGWTILAFADDGDGRLSPAEARGRQPCSQRRPTAGASTVWFWIPATM